MGSMVFLREANSVAEYCTLTRLLDMSCSCCVGKSCANPKSSRERELSASWQSSGVFDLLSETRSFDYLCTLGLELYSIYRFFVICLIAAVSLVSVFSFNYIFFSMNFYLAISV